MDSENIQVDEQFDQAKLLDIHHLFYTSWKKIYFLKPIQMYICWFQIYIRFNFKSETMV